jgi:pyruvate/2-oxoglutarate dehydrogenase complex dihydrolipoamide dehydrogenase (E3) component
VRNAARWGVHAENLRVDLPAIVGRKNSIVQQFRSGQERHVEQWRERSDLYRGHARFVAAKKIQVDGQDIESERIFVNTGTRPEIPRIEGLADSNYLTNATP